MYNYKLPLKLVFILLAAILVNTTLIESIHVMLNFDRMDSTAEAYLADADSRYQGCTLIDTYVDKDESYIPWDNYFTFHLVENAKGERLLAVVENHFLLSQARYREDLSREVPSFPPNQVPAFSADSGQMGYICTLAPDGSIGEAHTHGETGLNMPIILVPLLIAEYIAYILLFRREEIA